MSRKILLIDDSELTLKILGGVLEGAGYDVRASTQVSDLGVVLGSWRPEVILTDVNMPGISGVELCRKLKASYETAHVPVVLISALPQEELAELARECEADGYLSKHGGTEQLPDELALLIDSALF